MAQAEQMSKSEVMMLTVRDIEASTRFFEAAIGLSAVTFSGRRRILVIGEQQIHLCPQDVQIASAPSEARLLTWKPLAAVAARLQTAGVTLIEGAPANRGRSGILPPVFFHDPDGNLIEVAHYV